MGSVNLKPRFIDIVYLTVFVIALASGSRMLAIDSDLGRHLVLGKLILNEHIIPTRDLLSHTRSGYSRPPYEWLSQVLFALVHRWAGLDGVILLTALTLAATFALLYQISYRKSGSPVYSLIVVLIGAGASSLHWLPRPHIFTFLLLMGWSELLDKLKKDEHPRYYIYPIFMLFWANMHGGFIYGILVWTSYFAGWLWDTFRKRSNRQTGRKILITGCASLIATFITPDLWGNWEAVLNNRSAFILNRTIETMRPNLLDESVLPFTILLLTAVLLLARRWRKIKTHQILLLLGFGTLSLLMTRNIPLFVIVSIPIISEPGANSLSRFDTWKKIDERFAEFGSKLGLTVWVVIATLITSIYFTFQYLTNSRQLYQFDPQVFPVDAANYLRANPPNGNMFNEFNWGGYLLYRLWPEAKVFIDSQTDFYGEALVREYVTVESLQSGWEGVFDYYDIQWTIIPTESLLAEELDEMGWITLYKDETAIILQGPPD